MKTMLLNLTAPFTCLLLSACGSLSPDAAITGPKPMTVAELHTADHCTFEDSEEAGEKSTSGECMALRAKIKLQKFGIKQVSEYKQLAKTEQWTTVHERKENFKKADCKMDAPEQTEPCSTLLKDLLSSWEELRKTPEWTVFGKSEAYMNLKENLDRAKSIECIK